MYAAEIDSIRAYLPYPRNIKSNGKELLELEIKNDGSMTFYGLELLFSNDDGLEIMADKMIIDKIDPREAVIINIEIINNYKYYFSKDTFIRLKMSNDESSKNIGFNYTIKPVENFWVFIIMALALILTVLFILIFVKSNRGEENAR
jgi:uncharacterized membrane protein